MIRQLPRKMNRLSFLLAAFLLLPQVHLVSPAVAETLVKITYHPDPCKEVSALVRGRKVAVGGTTISLQSFYYQACEKVRQSIVDSIVSRAKSVRIDVETRVRGGIDDFYGRFRTWLADTVYQALDEGERAATTRDEYFEMWLQQPDRPLNEYVNHYIKTEMRGFHAALEKYRNDNSREIVGGLQEIWKNAKARLSAIVAAREELDTAPPETKYTDILRKHGLSASWLDKLQAYEGRFDRLDKSYDIVKTARMVHGAFTAEKYSGRIEGMFGIMEQLGSTMAGSKVPGISLLGTLVESYGKLAKEVLKQANALEKAIRSREGFCVGLATHTTTDKRGEAFNASVGKGFQACPLNLEHPLWKNVYYQTEPHNENQLYFWTGNDFVKGIETGGGRSGVNAAIDLIRGAAALGLSELASKDDDIETIADFYNAPYGAQYYLKGLPNHQPTSGLGGLVAEGVAVVEAISSRIRALRDHARLDQACGEDDFARLIEGESGLRLSVFPLDDGFMLDKLKTSYAVGFVQLHRSRGGGSRTQSYQRYRKVWERLAKLSMVTLQGRVVDKNRIGGPCEKCAGASLSMSVSQGREMRGCPIDRADDRGNFFARIVTRSRDVSIRSEARVGEIRSEEDLPVDARHLNLNGVDPPFQRHFSYNLLMPFEPDVSPGEALGALRALHAQAMQTQTIGKAACETARSATKAGQTQLVALKGRVSSLEARVKTMMPGLASLTSALSRLDDLTGEAERAATRVAEAKQKVEKAALLACKTARALRRERDKSAQRRAFSQVEVAAEDADAQAQAAKADFELAANAAENAESLASDHEAKALDIGKLPTEFAETEQAIVALSGKAKTVATDIQTIRAAKQKLDEMASRALAVHKTAIALIASVDPAMRGGLETEADRLLAQIRSAAGELESCLADTVEAMLGFSKDSTKISGALDALKTLVSSANLTRNGIPANERLLIGAGKARSSADVAEIFADIAASTAADAQRCLALAKAALSTGLDDDKSAAVEAAISICRFKQARSLLLTMRDHPNYKRLSTLFRSAVAREAKTLADFERSQALRGSGDLNGARAALEAARANTKCDRFRSRIDAALATLAAAAGDALAAEARSAIAACNFKTARGLISKLGQAGHEAHGEIKALYETALERERRTKALWQQAKAAQKSGRRDEAVGLLELARGNTKCDRYIGRIEQVLGNLRNTRREDPNTNAETEMEPEPEPPASDPEPEAGTVWVGPWRGTVRLTGLQLNGRSMSVQGALEMLANSNRKDSTKRQSDGSIAGNAGAVVDGLTEMFGDIAAALAAYVFSAMEVLEEGVEISFSLENGAGDYRLTLVEPGEDMKKSSDQIPPFSPTGDGRLEFHKSVDDEGRGQISTQLKLNETGERLSFSLVFNGTNVPGPDDPFQIRTIRAEIIGELSQGSIPANVMAAAIMARIERAAKRYLPGK